MKKQNRQDRQGVRTPADLERKYNLGQEEETLKLAQNAQTAAVGAQSAASAASAAAARAVLLAGNAQSAADSNAEIIAELQAKMEALDRATAVTVVVTASASASQFLTNYGALRVSGHRVLIEEMAVIVSNKTAQIEYTLSSTPQSSITVNANGKRLGSVTYAGESVSGSVSVSSWGDLSVSFTMN